MRSYNRNRSLSFLRRFCPHYEADRLVDIKPSDLVAKKISAVLLDLDNTLVNWKSREVEEETHAWIDECKSLGLKLCLVSNTRNPSRLAALSEVFGIPYAKGRMKPSRDAFQDALRIVGTEPSETAMIGDQMFTDVWGGNRLGLITILVRPRHPREFFGTKVSRILERVISRLNERAKIT